MWCGIKKADLLFHMLWCQFFDFYIHIFLLTVYIYYSTSQNDRQTFQKQMLCIDFCVIVHYHQTPSRFRPAIIWMKEFLIHNIHQTFNIVPRSC